MNRKTLLTLLLIILLTVVVTLLPGTIEQQLGKLLKPVFGGNWYTKELEELFKWHF